VDVVTTDAAFPDVPFSHAALVEGPFNSFPPAEAPSASPAPATRAPAADAVSGAPDGSGAADAPSATSAISVSPALPGVPGPVLEPVPVPPGTGRFPATARGTGPATAALLGVTLAWGASFVLMKDALASIPAADLLFERFALATAALLVLRPRALRGLGRTGWRHGVLIGLILAFSYLTQTYGLRTTPASVSGFITGLFVVFTPILGALLLRTRIAPAAWAGAGLALTGLGLLSLGAPGSGGLVGTGELLTLVCAIGWAAHITAIGAWTNRHDPYALAVVQLGTTAAVSLLIALPGGITLPHRGEDWLTLGFTALLCTAAAFFVQTYAQRRLSPTRTAVVMTMEPVFAGLAGTLSGEHLPVRGYVGAALVLASMYLVELRGKKKK
jgi:drug/metabolite transporter (DMT)-like permease